MTFEQSVQRECGRTGVPETAVAFAIDHHRRRGRTEAVHVSEAAALAEFYWRQLPEVDGAAQPTLSVTPLQVLTARKVEESVRDSVRKLRDQLFGDPDAHWQPHEYPDAVAWLEATQAELVAAAPQRDDGAVTQAGRLLVDAQREAERLVPWAAWRGASMGVPVLTYAGADGGSWVKRVTVPKGTSLHALADFSERVERGSGISRAVTVAHVLAAVSLYVPRARVSVQVAQTSLPDGALLKHQSFSVTFHTMDLRLDELRSVYRQMQEMLPQKDRRHRITDMDAELRGAIERLGGVPRNRRGFWQRVAEEMDFEGRPDSLEKRWRRLQSKQAAAQVVAGTQQNEERHATPEEE
jgi:hypothetical protein